MRMKQVWNNTLQGAAAILVSCTKDEVVIFFNRAIVNTLH